MITREGPTMNPLIPSPLDGLLAAAWALSAIISIAGFVSIVRAPMKPLQFLGWALFVFIIPFVGAGVWFRHRNRVATSPNN